MSTYSSKVGSPVSAVLIAPVITQGGDILLPAGSTLNGTVKRVVRVGFGVMHETAALDLEFRDIALPDGRNFPIATRVNDVDNSRERVTNDGSIHGVRPTSSIAYRISGYIRTALGWELHAHLAFWAVKTLLIQVPEPEIYYAPGAEFTLWVTHPIFATAEEPQESALTADERTDLEEDLAGMPYRAYTKANRPSDLLNMILIGSQEQIAAAFTAAGWSESEPQTWRSRVRNIRAVIEGRDVHELPMSKLFVNEVEPEMSWQKGQNDVAKRHHVRLWKQAATWQGQEIWIGAATRDVDFAYMRPGQALTHRIEQDVDHERDKIANDLEFTACTSLVDWWDRPGTPLEARNATGDPMSTDGRLAIVKLGDCAAPNRVAEAPPLRMHGNYFQRLARRQILSIRSDFYRKNMYWRTYEGTRWVVAAIRRRPPQSAEFRPTDGVADSLMTRVKNSSWMR